MRKAPPTSSESEFFERLSALVPKAQDWYHADSDGALWMTASYDDTADGVIGATSRIDFDGHELVCGRSPGYLNWDDGVRGRATGMSITPPDGLIATVPAPEVAAQTAAAWLDRVTQGRASAFEVIVEAPGEGDQVVVRGMSGIARAGAAITSMRLPDGSTELADFRIRGIERYDDVWVDELEPTFVGRLHLEGADSSNLTRDVILVGHSQFAEPH